MKQRHLSPLSVAIVFAVLDAPHDARAQYPTTELSRRSESSGPTAVTATGDYPITVPLELPTARAGLPVPLSVDPGRAGGVQVALSFVQRTSSFAHHKPRHTAGGTAAGREQVMVSLLGTNVDMVPDGPNKWVPRAGLRGLVLLWQADGTWLLDDGEGRTFRFARPGGLPGDTPLWLLTTITGHGAANRVELAYGVIPHDLPGSTGMPLHAYSIRLEGLLYNLHPTTAGCAKHWVDLSYQASAAPLDLSFVGGTAMVRMSTLTEVAVHARPSCTGPSEQLTRYTFSYEADPDTGLPQLRSVQRFGRAGKPGAEMPITVVTYRRGAASASGKLTFRRAADIPVPAATEGLTRVEQDDDLHAPGSTLGSVVTRQELIDMTCDGRADLVFEDEHGRLMIAVNRPGPDGTTTFAPPDPLDGGAEQLPQPNGPLTMVHKRTFWPGAYVDDSGGSPPLDPDEWPEDDFPPDDPAPNLARFPGPAHVVENEWRTMLDWNGDGCIDLLRADEVERTWVVYLNGHGGLVPGMWTRIPLDVSAVWQALVERYGWDQEYVPLSSRITTRGRAVTDCLRREGAGWTQDECGAANYFPFDEDPAAEDFGLRTVTRFELKDLNGDAYPDFLLTVEAAEKIVEPLEPPLDNTYEGPTLHRVGFREPTAEVQVMYNDVGARLYEGVIPFSAPRRVLDSPQGVATWAQAEDGSLHPVDAFIDVNGDALLDRTRGTRVDLQDGNGEFRPAFELPEVIATNAGITKLECDDPDVETYVTHQGSGLQDFTGDGRPDFYHGASFNLDGSVVGGRIAVATGSGFTAAAKTIEMTGANAGSFQFAHRSHDCEGLPMLTVASVADLDGDGVAEMVRRARGSNVLEVLHVSGPSDPLRPGVPDAGRIVEVETGHGARTTITYENAKRDGTTHHLVPFPEIVVAAVETTGTRELGGNTAQVRFAYGSALLHFDPARDRHVFPGYLRRVALTLAEPGPLPNTHVGAATITESHPLEPFDPSMSPTERWARYARVGRPREVHVLAGTFSSDPWKLVAAPPNTDGRRVAATRTTHAARTFDGPVPVTLAGLDCLDWMAPLDPQLTLANSVVGPSSLFCGQRGFVYLEEETTSRGRFAPPPGANVATRTRVLDVDELGRPRKVWLENDVRVADDDLCVATSYANPIFVAGTGRVLMAVASREVSVCPPDEGPAVVLAREVTHFDGLPFGSAGAGRPTSGLADRRSADDGSVLGAPVSTGDTRYDATGNVVELRRERSQDGGGHSVTFSYDPFGLAPVLVSLIPNGTEPEQHTSYTHDPYTLQVLSVTDPNGTVSSAAYDAFGRRISTALASPGESVGVVSLVSYDGFTGPDPLGPRITTRTFPDPVPAPATSTATAEVHTVYLDELLRERRVETSLGEGYPSPRLITTTSYDLLGRVAFVSDPYAEGEAAPHYGTTHHHNADGTLRCSIRGHGPQPLTAATDEAQELYPTCFVYDHVNHQAVTEMMGPDALLAGAPQEGVKRVLVKSAIGRLLFDSTWKGATRLEHAAHTYDRLSNPRDFSRYQHAALAADEVTTTQRWDSLGRRIAFTPPGAATLFYDHDEWGAVTATRFTDTTPKTPVVRSTVVAYDALGRPARTYETADGAPLPETEATFDYDVEQPVLHEDPGAPYQPARNLVGRLSRATWATGALHLGYDAAGHVESRTYTDGAGFVAVEQVESHLDGRAATIRLFLPDTSYKEERIDYRYDEASRLRAVTYEGITRKRVFEAQTIDPLGFVRDAHLNDGVQALTLDYAETGRRALRRLKVSTPGNALAIGFGTPDPAGRERSRVEEVEGATISHTYDALGRVASSTRIGGGPMISSSFAYDPLGNLRLRMEPMRPTDVAMSHLSGPGEDRDRLCRIVYGDVPFVATPCNVVHDASGNVIEQPTRAGGTRRFEYLASGQVRRIDDGTAVATFRYDAFGALQELDVDGPVPDVRRDRHYGAMVEVRDGKIWRHVLGPDGILATYRAAEDVWTFPYDEARGTRIVFDGNDQVVQQLGYEAFGETASAGSQPGDPEHTNRQWNGGDALDAFGCLVQLGARLYDPCIGRFLSRDPLFIPRTAAATHAYAFALNDPINLSDPEGLDACDGELLCISKTYDPGVAQHLGEAWAFADFITRSNGDFGYESMYEADPERAKVFEEAYEDKLASMRLDRDLKGRGVVSTVGDLHMLPVYAAGQAVCGFFACDQEAGGGYKEKAVPDGEGGWVRKPYVPKSVSYAEHALNVGLDRLVPKVMPKLMPKSGPRSVPKHGSCPTCGADPTCFTAGTPVSTSAGLVPIETVQPGARVRSLDEALCTEPIDADSCRTIEIAMDDPFGYPDTLRARFLRSEAWVSAHEAKPGAEIALDLEELDVRGRGRVVSVGPCALEGGPGCLVTGTVTHLNRSVLRLRFADSDVTLEPTARHRLWSVDRAAWVPAGELAVGERLRTAGGEVAIAAIERVAGEHPVFNIEVAGAQTYLVSGLRIQSHNTCWHDNFDIVARWIDAVEHTNFYRIGLDRGREVVIGNMFRFAYQRMNLDRFGYTLRDKLQHAGALDYVRLHMRRLLDHPRWGYVIKQELELADILE